MFTLNQMACLENSQRITYALKQFLQGIQSVSPLFQRASRKGSAYMCACKCAWHLGDHTNWRRCLKGEGGRIEMPVSKSTIQKTLPSPSRDEKGHNH